MPVEDPDPVEHDTARRMHDDLARQLTDEPHVVVPEHDPDVEPFSEETGKEVEDHGTERGRSPDDRVLHISGDEEGRRPVPGGEHDELLCHTLPRRFGRTGRPGAAASEAEVHVGDDDRASIRRLRRLEQEGRRVRDRA